MSEQNPTQRMRELSDALTEFETKENEIRQEINTKTTEKENLDDALKSIEDIERQYGGPKEKIRAKIKELARQIEKSNTELKNIEREKGRMKPEQKKLEEVIRKHNA